MKKIDEMHKKILSESDDDGLLSMRNRSQCRARVDSSRFVAGYCHVALHLEFYVLWEPNFPIYLQLCVSVTETARWILSFRRRTCRHEEVSC